MENVIIVGNYYNYMENEKKEEEKNKEREPNVIIKCPVCGGGMRKSTYHNELSKKPIVEITCVKCGKKL